MYSVGTTTEGTAINPSPGPSVRPNGFLQEQALQPTEGFVVAIQEVLLKRARDEKRDVRRCYWDDPVVIMYYSSTHVVGADSHKPQQMQRQEGNYPFFSCLCFLAPRFFPTTL